MYFNTIFTEFIMVVYPYVNNNFCINVACGIPNLGFNY